MAKRIYPANATETQRREIDRLSDLSAYAYGFSDEKPGVVYWIIVAAMCGFVAWRFVQP